MAESQEQSTYRKIEIDNPICNRRFHIAFEQGKATVPEVKVDCPHCGIKVFEARNHPPVILAREENLIASPDGTRPLLHECKFLT